MNDATGSLRTANYSGGFQKKLSGLEHLMCGNFALPFHVAEYWQWAYSDMLRNTQRGVFAEYLVKAALDLGGIRVNEEIRSNFEPFDLLGPEIRNQVTPPHLEYSSYDIRNCRIEVKSSSYIQSWDPHPGTIPKISFSIAPAKLPDKYGDFRPDAPRQRNSDLYIFAIYTATKKEQNILDTNLWEFYVVQTSVLNEKCGEQKTLSLAKLKTLGSNKVAFCGLCQSIVDACKEMSASQ